MKKALLILMWALSAPLMAMNEQPQALPLIDAQLESPGVVPEFANELAQDAEPLLMAFQPFDWIMDNIIDPIRKAAEDAFKALKKVAEDAAKLVETTATAVVNARSVEDVAKAAFNSATGAVTLAQNNVAQATAAQKGAATAELQKKLAEQAKALAELTGASKATQAAKAAADAAAAAAEIAAAKVGEAVLYAVKPGTDSFARFNFLTTPGYHPISDDHSARLPLLAEGGSVTTFPSLTDSADTGDIMSGIRRVSLVVPLNKQQVKVLRRIFKDVPGFKEARRSELPIVSFVAAGSTHMGSVNIMGFAVDDIPFIPNGFECSNPTRCLLTLGFNLNRSNVPGFQRLPDALSGVAISIQMLLVKDLTP